MAHRQFIIFTPADTVYRSIYALILQNYAASFDLSTLPDRVYSLFILSATGTVLIGGPSGGANGNLSVGAGSFYSRVTQRNSICLRDYTISANSQQVNIDLDFA